MKKFVSLLGLISAVSCTVAPEPNISSVSQPLFAGNKNAVFLTSGFITGTQQQDLQMAPPSYMLFERMKAAGIHNIWVNAPKLEPSGLLPTQTISTSPQFMNRINAWKTLNPTFEMKVFVSFNIQSESGITVNLADPAVRLNIRNESLRYLVPGTPGYAGGVIPFDGVIYDFEPSGKNSWSCTPTDDARNFGCLKACVNELTAVVGKAKVGVFAPSLAISPPSDGSLWSAEMYWSMGQSAGVIGGMTYSRASACDADTHPCTTVDYINYMKTQVQKANLAISGEAFPPGTHAAPIEPVDYYAGFPEFERPGFPAHAPYETAKNASTGAAQGKAALALNPSALSHFHGGFLYQHYKAYTCDAIEVPNLNCSQAYGSNMWDPITNHYASFLGSPTLPGGVVDDAWKSTTWSPF